MAMGAGPGGLPEVVVFGASAGPQNFLAFPTQSTSGVRVALGDINGDGVSDLIAGSGSSGAVRVFSGASGAMLQDSIAFDAAAGGVFVAAGDVTGDGRADLIVGNGGASAQGHVKVFDGRTFQLVATYFAYDTSFSGGVRVAVGDFNGDGFADVATSPGPGAAPHVKVFSGANHSLLREFFAFSAGFTGGVFVAAGMLTAMAYPTSSSVRMPAAAHKLLCTNSRLCACSAVFHLTPPLSRAAYGSPRATSTAMAWPKS